MNNVQRAKLDSYGRVVDFETKFATELTTIDEYAEEQTIFDTSYGKIKAAVMNQQAKAGASNEAVELAKKAMASVTIKYALRGKVKAKQIGNTTVANKLDIAESTILRATKTEAVEIAAEIKTVLNDNIAALTNITAGNITEIGGKITAYDEMKDDPIESVQTKKATGTDILPEEFDKADEANENKLGLVQSYFGESNPTMVDEMELALKIINTGIRHTPVDIKVVADESGLPIVGASVTDYSTNKTYVADDDGIVHIGTHRAGKLKFAAVAAGRVKVSIDATVVRGTDNNFTIRMVAG